jgi:pyrimidine-specific ribonucleoside hydrolase
VFASPADGDHIAGSIAIQMAADGVTIEPAGEVHPDAGHFHVMVDTECVEAGAAIPKDGGHRHFGKGQSDSVLSLPAGEHTLCLQVGDGTHLATGLTDEITVTVGVTTLEEWCGVVREVGVILDGNSLDAPIEELQPIHADVVALMDQLIAGIDVIDDEHRGDVLTITEGQQMLSQAIVDATDATAMKAEIDELTSQVFVVAEGTYEWVGTTCGLDEDDEDPDVSSDEPLVQAASHGDVSVIVDQSPTVSDIGALGFLAARPDVELLAVTMPSTGEADCSPGAVTTRAVLEAAGRGDVPIGCGGEPLDGTNEWPSAWRESADALAETVAPGADEPTYDDAESVLAETLASADTPVTIVALGPLTNIAAVLQTDPSLADRIEQIVVMGGAVSVAGNVEPDLSAEWNFHAHPIAARSVINSGVPITLVPLDATDQVPMTTEYVAGVRSIDNGLARVHGAALGSLESLDYMFMWDELAAVLAVQPEVATWSDHRVVVDDDGATVESPEGTLVKVAVDADAASVQSLVLGALNEFGG